MNEQFLKDLMDTICPTGFEEEGASVWMKEASKFTDNVWSDSHGNAFAVINKGKYPYKIMLAGHMDEIGLIISYINENGYLYFKTLGGWDPQILPGQRIRIKTKNGIVKGVIGSTPIHHIESDSRGKAVKIKDLYIDIGVGDKEEAEKLVEIGDCAVIDYGYEELRDKVVVSRAFDDRIGAFVVLEALRMLSDIGYSDIPVCAVATSQEEIGCRGAFTSTFNIDPVVGIAVDVGFTSDTPSLEGKKKEIGDIKLGGGPIIAKGPNTNPILFKLILDTAKVKDIPYQVEIEPGPTGTDARAIQITRSGVATGLISIPSRYMHSPNEIINLDDVKNTYELIAHTIRKIDITTSFCIGE